MNTLYSVIKLVASTIIELASPNRIIRNSHFKDLEHHLIIINIAPYLPNTSHFYDNMYRCVVGAAAALFHIKQFKDSYALFGVRASLNSILYNDSLVYTLLGSSDSLEYYHLNMGIFGTTITKIPDAWAVK